MKARSARLLALCSVSLVGACAEEGDAGLEGPAVEIEVAPLTLPGTTGVEYALAVFNTNPTPYSSIYASNNGQVVGSVASLVWEQTSVTSVQYGSGPGGDVSYVGTCDAQKPTNYVALVLKQVAVTPGGGSYNGIGPNDTVANTNVFVGADNILDDENSAGVFSTETPVDPDFVNPCDWKAPCVLAVPCEENEDNAVVFNLTIMRDADQGFFDIAVNFEDIFCSAKVDTCYDGMQPIKLLFDSQGNRVDTAVIASACTKGAGGTGNTEMWMSPVRVSCNDGTNVFEIDPTGGATAATAGEPGNRTVPVSVGGTPYNVGYALYWGEEAIDCPTGTDCDKEFWNIAINLNDLKTAGLFNCSVTTDITASSSSDSSPPPFVNGKLKGPGQAYGFVKFQAILNDNTGTSKCFQGPMGSDYAKITYGTTADLGGDAFPQLCSKLEQGAASPKALKDITGYFKDTNSSQGEAVYAGRIRKLQALSATFEQMGAFVARPCGSALQNSVEILYFDKATDVVRAELVRAANLKGTYEQAFYARTDGQWGVLDFNIDSARGVIALQGQAFENAELIGLKLTLTNPESLGEVPENVVFDIIGYDTAN